MNLKSIIILIVLLFIINGIVHVIWLKIDFVTLDMIPAHNWISVNFLLIAAAFFIGKRMASQ